jgi:hypothetical protein
MAKATNTKAITLNDVSVWIDTANGDKERIGMIQTVSVNLVVNKTTLYEAGKKGSPVDRVFLKKEVSGSFERILVDKAFLVKLWPSFASDPVVFDLRGVAVDEKGVDRNFTVLGCTIDGFPIEHSLENETKQTINFTGLGFRWDN